MNSKPHNKIGIKRHTKPVQKSLMEILKLSSECKLVDIVNGVLIVRFLSDNTETAIKLTKSLRRVLLTNGFRV